MQKNDLRYNFIDLVESIACFFVVMYHSLLIDIDLLNINDFSYTSLMMFIMYCMKGILSTCVPLFFMCNGFLLFQKNLSLRKHIYKIIKLTVQVTFWSLFTSAIKSQLFFGGINLSNVYNNLRIFWFVDAIICIYIVFPALKIMFDHEKKIFIYILVVLFLLTFILPFTNDIIVLSDIPIITNIKTAVASYYSYFNPFRSHYAYSFVYFMGGVWWGGCLCTINMLFRSRLKLEI